ncbi:MAG: hypothetical protein GC151_13735 [Betaproteobacteria bacterium]|nr:hypothetical protein [Betaproteobacteria bacterium]
MTTMNDIEAATKAFADARSTLVDRTTALRDELEKVRRKHLRGIRKAVADTKAAQTLLTNRIDGARELFEKPRSTVFHGVKVGLQKSKDTLEWSDSRLVAERVNELLPEQRDTLIEVTYKPVVGALMQLDANTLKSIGVRQVPGRDSILIKPVDGGVEKLVTALLKEIDQVEGDEEVPA